MSRKNKESSLLSDRFYEKVFKIKLKGAQEVPLTNDFMKTIEQEYAIKYLESLSIEPTKANITMILKANPLKNCKFGAGWNTSGRVADTLTIIARQKTKASLDSKMQGLDTEESKAEKKNPAEIKSALIKLGKEETKTTNDANKQNKGNNLKGGKKLGALKFLGGMDDQENGQAETEHKFQIDYNIDSIKQKYLYPFNESKQKKLYQNLTDDPTTSYLPPLEKGANNDVLNALKYYFPFSHVKVPSSVLKELQAPLKITHPILLTELNKFVENFPFSVFPQQKSKSDNDASNSTFQTPHESRISEKLPPSVKGRWGHLLKETDIEKCKNALTSDEMGRLVGVVGHLTYWQVFGHLNPVQPDLITKKQMILISMEQMNLLRKKVKNFKLWSLFVLPMLVLTLRMMIEFILRNNYVSFFEIEKPCAIALEKANLLITNMFDPNMLYSRFAFFESEIEAVNKKFTDHLDETKMRSKRIYGTNPYIDLYFPRPESDFVRNIRQKKNNTKKIKVDTVATITETEKETKDTIEDQPNKESTNNKAYLNQSYKVKMFQVLLDRIDEDLGNKFNNIINYDKK